MTGENYWRLLFVDDNAENCELAVKFLNEKVISAEGDKLRVDTEVVFDKALNTLESGHFDFVVLDVRLGDLEGDRAEEEGIKVLESIKSRCFVPIIFYTGLPEKVRDLQSPLIKVIENTEGLPKVLSTIKEIFATRLPLVNRTLIQHAKEVQRDYMWGFVANYWGAFGDTPDKTSLAYLLARRLSKSLDNPGIQKLAEKLGGAIEILCSEDKVHPMNYYIVPPITARPLAGDIIKEEQNGNTKYLVLITPSCDIVRGKVDVMLFADCVPLREIKAFIDWQKNKDDPSTKYINKLLDMLTNNKERYFFLPGIFNIPDLIVDYQKTMTLESEKFYRLAGEGKLVCIASLDSPYCESLLSRFSRYFGRLGVPDLNIELVQTRLESDS